MKKVILFLVLLQFQYAQCSIGLRTLSCIQLITKSSARRTLSLPILNKLGILEDRANLLPLNSGACRVQKIYPTTAGRLIANTSYHRAIHSKAEKETNKITTGLTEFTFSRNNNLGDGFKFSNLIQPGRVFAAHFRGTPFFCEFKNYEQACNIEHCGTIDNWRISWYYTDDPRALRSFAESYRATKWSSNTYGFVMKWPTEVEASDLQGAKWLRWEQDKKLAINNPAKK